MLGDLRSLDIIGAVVQHDLSLILGLMDKVYVLYKERYPSCFQSSVASRLFSLDQRRIVRWTRYSFVGSLDVWCLP